MEYFLDYDSCHNTLSYYVNHFIEKSACQCVQLRTLHILWVETTPGKELTNSPVASFEVEAVTLGLSIGS